MGQPLVEDLASDIEASRMALLAQSARALHAEENLDRALAWAVDAAARLGDSHEVAICLLPRDGSPTWTVHPRASVNFRLLGDPRTYRALRPGLAPGGVLAVEDLAAHEKGAAASERLRRVLPVDRLIVMPAAVGEDGVLGAIFIADTEPGAFMPGSIDALLALASHLGIALRNHERLLRFVEVEARGKEVVYQLQEAVRPPAPVVESTELGVHYVAADPSAPTGGDLYDWTVLPDGDLHLTVVDIMGKGVEATKHAMDVTHTLRYLAITGCPLEEMVECADRLITAQNPELVATLVVARYTPSTGRLLLAGAGHPPALIVSGADVREINAPGIPIGWPGAGSHEIAEVNLDRSDTLLLYTDGLIEATKDILQGLEDLSFAAAATSSYPARAMARALVERQLADSLRQDDTLALVLRRRTPPVGHDRVQLAPFSHQFTPSLAAVSLARHLLRDWLEAVPVDADATDSLVLVASELLANAVRHASGEPSGVHLGAAVEGDGVVIEVQDDGGDMTLPPRAGDELPDPDAERGRGLFLVRELTDDVVGDSDGERTTVRVTKRAVVAAAREG